jgi:hypothetical protein
MRQATASANALTIDGTQYAWEFRHAWVVESGKGLKGLSVSVWLEPGKTRELILDFDFKVFGLDRNPPQPVMSRAVARGILSAIQAGWVPNSRGRAFRHKVGEGG